MTPATVPGAPTGAPPRPGNSSSHRHLHRAGLQRRLRHHRLHRHGDRHHHPANGGQTATGTASPITVTGLTNGDSYTFTVTATNGIGTGPASAASNAVTPASVPGAPTGVSATAGKARPRSPSPRRPPTVAPHHRLHRHGDRHDHSANGGQTHGHVQPDHRHRPHQRRRLHLHRHRHQRHRDRPGLGRVELGDPGHRTRRADRGPATAGNAQATVTFTAPASNGGSTITGYTVTATDTTTPANGGQTATGTSSPITVTGLTNGDTYTFTVTATNGVGTGPASAASNAVTPLWRSTPPAPPAGATSSQGASSSSSSGTATATVSGLSASGSGEGALTVATYSGNPVAGSVSGGTGVYYDVALSSGNAFGSVSITISNLGPGGQSIDWWNGSAWVPFSDQTYDAATHSVTITVSATTSPTLAQLNGTPIAVSSNPAPSRGYWEVASDGGIFSFGGASFYGSEGGKPLNAPIVGIAAPPTARATGRSPATAASSASATPSSTAPRAASR